VQTDLQTTLLVALSYLIVNILIGNILEPRIMGRGLGISTLAVFLSLLFWGWVLGTVGVFLAVQQRLLTFPGAKPSRPLGRLTECMGPGYSAGGSGEQLLNCYGLDAATTLSSFYSWPGG
jgi:AI-2 transport protein TqsA